MKILQWFHLGQSRGGTSSVITIPLYTKEWWPTNAWPTITQKLRNYTYRNDHPVIHWRWLELYPGIGPSGWYVWATQPAKLPQGSIEVFLIAQSTLMKASLDFHAAKSLDVWPSYHVIYDHLWIDNLVVAPPIQGLGLGSRLLTVLDDVASFLNVSKIHGLFGYPGTSPHDQTRLARFYHRHHYQIHGSCIEKLCHPSRMLTAAPPSALPLRARETPLMSGHSSAIAPQEQP